MRQHIFAKQTAKRIATLFSAFVVAVSALSATLPFILSQQADAAPNTVYTNTGFGGLSWSADRTAPSGGYTNSGGTLTMNVNGGATNANQAFYKYEGLKAALPANTNTVRASLYVDPAWENQDVLIGMWGQVETSTVITGSGAVNYNPAWPTLEFNNIDPGSHQASVDVWNTFTGNLEGVTTVSYGSTISLEIAVDPVAGTFDYYLNGVSIFSQPNTYTADASDAASTNLTVGQVISYNNFSHIIFDNLNSGASYTVKWSNLQLGKSEAPKPTGLVIKRDSNHAVVTNGVVNDPNDTLTWSGTLAPGASWQIKVTDPNGVVNTSRRTQSIGFDLNDATRYGLFGTLQGKYTYQVRQQAGGPYYEGLSDWSDPVSLTFDSIPPVLTKVTANGKQLDLNGVTAVNGQSGVQLAAVCTDAQSPNSLSWITFGQWTPNQDNRISGYSITVPANRLSDGQTYSFTVDCSDEYNYAGLNHQVTTVNFKVDNTAPYHPTNLQVNGQSGTFYTQVGAPFTQTWQESVKSKDVVGYNYESCYVSQMPASDSCSGSKYTTTLGTTSKKVGAGDTKHDEVFFWHVQAFDAAGNTSGWSSWSEVVVDSTAPSVPVNGQPSGVYKTSNVFNYTWDPSTDNLSPVHYEYQASKDPTTVGGVLVNSVWNSASGSATQKAALMAGPSIPSEGTSDGTWYWQVRAVDAAGNKSAWSQVWSYTLDSVKPVVTVNSLSTTNTTPTLTGTVDDHTATVTVKVDGHTYTAVNNQDGTWTANIADALALGVYDVSASATDPAGNVGYTTANAVLTISAAPTALVTPPAAQLIIGPTANLFSNAAPQGSNGDQQGSTTPTDQAVEGAQTQKSNTNNNDQAVEGASTTKGPWSLWGVAWYWWLVILAILGAIIWWLIAGYRRNANEA